MPRGQESINTGGQINPYVQQSLQQNKQLAENRLLTAVQQSGETQRTAMRERGATQRTAMQTGAQRAMQAAQIASEDRRAAETERARREDREYARTQSQMAREFQAKQAELDREQQLAIQEKDFGRQREIEQRREALRRFNIEMSLDSQERNTNAMLSIIKGSLKRESSMEKAKTVLYEESEKFNRDKDVYQKVKARVVENADFDKRMDLPVRGEMETKAVPAGVPGGFSSGFMQVRTGKIKPGTQADPMGVLQDQINKSGGNISTEELSPEKIKMLEDQIQQDKIKSEDINRTLGAIEGMVDVLDKRRKSFGKKTEEFDFWNKTYLTVTQMRDNLEGLSKSTKKIANSDTETVGARVQYALGTVYDSSLGGQVSKLRKMVGDDFNAVFDEMTKPIQVPKPYGITPEMNEYDIEYRNWFNNYLQSRHPEMGGVK